MVLLQGKVQPGEERVYHLNTKDFLRPPLKQIGNSIADIRSYFEKKGVINMMPDGPKKDLEDIDADLLSLLQEDCVLSGDNIVKGACSGTCTDASCLVFLSESLATTFNISASPPPFEHKCDIFIAMPKQPLIILTVADDSTATGAERDYNASVAREVTSKLRAFTSESVNIVHGVICRRDLKDSRTFHRKLLLHAALSSLFLPKSTFSTSEPKYSRVLTAVWAAMAQTRAVLAEIDTSIRFLTKEQCVVLVENMNSKHVQVRCEPGSGATTLMLEVTRRLSRLGETLLVCRSREETDRLSLMHPSTVSMCDVGYLDLSKFENIVHDTDDILYQQRGRHWQFLREST
ncbi:uncharacterized protein LOC124283381 isoform X1 [Haliotis rubra]|uniref:uncharacterized protein LOC124283381 isoform X1 n=1 Tax=Haliotis rubra TaxID=36100 RepID=UPI001EE5092C|nr:uncharacterized protein LOC124283381 isoform X1 [Haliotis rubra]